MKATKPRLAFLNGSHLSSLWGSATSIKVIPEIYSRLEIKYAHSSF